jgi:hypothetical protein
MQFQVVDIEFDTSDSVYESTVEDEQELYADYVGTFWEADDDEDLIEEITSAAGYCISSINYRHVLS